MAREIIGQRVNKDRGTGNGLDCMFVPLNHVNQLQMAKIRGIKGWKTLPCRNLSPFMKINGSHGDEKEKRERNRLEKIYENNWNGSYGDEKG